HSVMLGDLVSLELAKASGVNPLPVEAIEPHAAFVIRLETEGETRTERVLHSVMLGDLVSLELAKASGVDPLPVEAIERFKADLGRP
ncbi:MAG TPA: SIS domain-containing protein, partial [Solirubrobacterales bacterium]|nr:SIS domain-containing protein [Solirubrobacterales bacterium]